MIKENIKKIQKELIKFNIGAYIVPTNDYHASEYISSYFKERQFLSNFTGSQGTLVISSNNAYLFVDGRYFLQAEKEIENTSINLMRMGEKNVPTLEELIDELLKDKPNLGVNAKYISIATGKRYLNIVKKHNGELIDLDLVSSLWKDRPSLPKEKLWILDNIYNGKDISIKLEDIRNEMKKKKATSFLLTSLDDIAWILNLRGGDIPNNPVFLSYLLIEQNRANLYIDQDKLTDEVRAYLKHNNIHIRDYFKLDNKLERLSGKVMLDENKVNYSCYLHINARTVNVTNPTLLMKAIKNPIEIENLKLAHIKDGVALTKFMYYLKTNIGKIPMTEISVQDYLYDLRSKQDHYISPSFNTICAYKDHAAMMHYSASKESDISLKPEGMLLVDSGGQYLEGTTDVTRTFILGPISEEEKHFFTLTLQSNLNLHSAIFMKGCRGLNLDILARGPIWNEYIDYKCGTGHGVSYLMNVHEGPNGFRWRVVPERDDSAELVPGMITTDEPGVYFASKFGIRHETELLCVEKASTEWGDFLGFECITLCPFDLDGIIVNELTEKQRKTLNEYHKEVYKKISPYLNEEERLFLKEYTREI